MPRRAKGTKGVYGEHDAPDITCVQNLAIAVIRQAAFDLPRRRLNGRGITFQAWLKRPSGRFWLDTAGVSDVEGFRDYIIDKVRERIGR
jgi:hypothetical protein